MTRPGGQVGRLAPLSQKRTMTERSARRPARRISARHKPSHNHRHANGSPAPIVEHEPRLGLLALAALLQAVRVLEEAAAAYAQEEATP